MPQGTPLWVYFKTSKSNDPVRWIKATFISTVQHIIQCRRSSRGPLLTVSYEYILLAPRGAFTYELRAQSLEEAISYPQGTCATDTDEDHTSKEPGPTTPPILDSITEEHPEDIETPAPLSHPHEPIESQNNGIIPNTQRSTGTLAYDIFGSEDGKEEPTTIGNDENVRVNPKVVPIIFTTLVLGIPEDDIGTSTLKDPPNG